MSADFLAQPRPARRRAVAAVAALGLVLAAAAVLTSHSRRSATASPAPAATAATGSPTASAEATPSATSATAQQRIALVEGLRQVNGVAVGYPHSEAGAVSAAMEYTIDVGSNLDFDRAERMGEAINDPASGRSIAAYAEGTAENRKDLGLPVTGAVPTGASMSADPVSYQLRDQSPDRVTVLLLCYLTTITPARGMHNVVIVIPTLMTWTHGDWKLGSRSAGAPDYAQLRYQPGSTDAVAAGWLPLTA